jgi:hypothetical protein
MQHHLIDVRFKDGVVFMSSPTEIWRRWKESLHEVWLMFVFLFLSSPSSGCEFDYLIRDSPKFNG